MEHYDNDNILTEAQDGFRPGHSCESQLITIIADLVKCLDNREEVDAVILDFSKAFDRVPRQRLLLKLHHYGNPTAVDTKHLDIPISTSSGGRKASWLGRSRQ